MALEKTYQDFVADARKRVSEIDPEELSAAMANGGGPVILDVREPQETEAGVIPGAINIPRGVLERDIAKAFCGRVRDEDLDRPIIVYCSSGSRSLMAAQTLLEMGFTNVRSLRNGWRGWIVAAC